MRRVVSILAALLLTLTLLLPALAGEDAGEAEPSGDNEIYVQEKDTELTEPSPDPTAEPPAEPTEAPAEAPGEEPSPEPTEAPEADPGEVRCVTITWQVTDAQLTAWDEYCWNVDSLTYEKAETCVDCIPAAISVTVQNGLETAVTVSLTFVPADGVDAELDYEPLTVAAESEDTLEASLTVRFISGMVDWEPGQTARLNVGTVTVTVEPQTE